MAKKRDKTRKVSYKPGLNLRAGPSKEDEILRVLKYGETVTPDHDREAPEGWMAVDGGGYVMTEFLD